MKDTALLKSQIAKVIQKSPISDKISAVYIFGSYAKNQQNPNSDLDVLVVLKEPVGFDFIRLEYALEDQLGLKIDLLTQSAISPYLIDEINQSKQLVYEG